MVAIASLVALAACQAATLSSVSGDPNRPFFPLDGKQAPLPRDGPASWLTVAERSYAAPRGTPMFDVVLLQAAAGHVQAVIWITTNNAPQAQRAGWRMASFCRQDAAGNTRVFIDRPDGRQDCWAVRSQDTQFRDAENPTLRALGDYLAREKLVLDPTLSTVSFHYANDTDLLDITYGFSEPSPATPAAHDGRPRSDAPADLKRWAATMHLLVRLGFHGLLDQDTMPAPVIGPVAFPEKDGQQLPPPTSEGVATPQPRTPLRQVKGLVGDIPENNRASVDLLAANFDRQVFQTEYGGPYPWLRKWSRNPVLRISPALSATARAGIKRTARLLHEITGLDFTIAPWRDPPVENPNDPENAGNILFLASSGDAGPGSCFGRFHSMPDGSVDAGVIFISPELLPEFVEECVTEEFAQILGPFNDTTYIAQSIFNDQTNGIVSWLTWHDAVVLRTLYDERLKPGMPRDRAMPIARRIIAGLVAGLN